MAADKMTDDKLAPHRKAVADAISTLSGFTDKVSSKEAGAVRDALGHMGRAHAALTPVKPNTPPVSYF